MKEFGIVALTSLTPITAKEAEKFCKASFEVSRLQHPDMDVKDSEMRMIYNVSWYAVSKGQQ